MAHQLYAVATDQQHHLMLKLLSQETGRTMSDLTNMCIDKAYGGLCDQFAKEAEEAAISRKVAMDLIKKHPSISLEYPAAVTEGPGTRD